MYKKQLLLTLIYFLSQLFSNVIQAQKNKLPGELVGIKKPQLKLSKQAKKYFSHMVLIPGGSFTKGNYCYDGLKALKVDTSLLIPLNESRVTVSSFYLSDHEVTNAEYKEFIQWVSDSIKLYKLAQKDSNYYTSNKSLNWIKAKEFLKNDTNKIPIEELMFQYGNIYEIYNVNIYPKVNSWKTDFIYAYLDPMAKYYFTHPAYNDYPVVGVSYYQANAYCAWKTKMLNDAIMNNLKDHSKPILYPNFRLPTEAEWEYAYYGGNKSEQGFIYSWDGVRLFNNEGKYYANFGNVKDEQGVHIKSYIDDGSFYPSRVKSYEKNKFGLFDMAGNVAEWTLDHAFTISTGRFSSEKLSNDYRSEEKFSINASDDINSATNKLVLKLINEPYFLKSMYGVQVDSLTKIDTNNQGTMRAIRYLAEKELHNVQVLNQLDYPTVVKGGSWADPTIYILGSTKEAKPRATQSCRIGFRLAMTYLEYGGNTRY